MTWYLLRLIAARPDFAFTMSEAEQQTMARHSSYWKAYLSEGVALIYSPVADPAGPWGLCIARAEDEAGARSLADNDPAVLEGVGHYEVMELFSPIIRGDAG